jgi:hypothetical protein
MAPVGRKAVPKLPEARSLLELPPSLSRPPVKDRRWQRWLLGSLLLLGLVWLLLELTRFTPQKPVDVDITFTVADAETGRPVDQFDILLRPDEPRGEGTPPPVRLHSRGGVVCRRCTGCGCAASLGLFGPDFEVHLPGWRFEVVAAGFKSSAVLDLRQYAGRARPEPHGRVAVQVPLVLRREK